LSHVVLHFRRRPHSELVFITRAEAGELAQFQLDDDLGKLALGSYFAELSEALAAEHAEANEAYRLLAAALEALARSGASAALSQALALRMRNGVGFGLEFSRCGACGSEENLRTGASYFVVARGGVLCARCRPSVVDGAIRIEAASTAALDALPAIAFENAGAARAA